MKTEQVKQVLNERGYAVHYNGIVCDVYDWSDQQVGRCLVHTLERITNEGSNIIAWQPYDGVKYWGHYLGVKYRRFENFEHCESIANDLADYVAGRVQKCPECGETVSLPDNVGDVYKCPHCGEVAPTGCGYGQNTWEELSLYDYFSDCLDIEYRCNSRKEYKSVEICVAWGGPNIYIDTSGGYVNLYWGGEKADYPLSTDVVESIDDWAEEYWNCL